LYKLQQNGDAPPIECREFNAGDELGGAVDGVDDPLPPRVRPVPAEFLAP
jgi:hypothetical protein